MFFFKARVHGVLNQLGVPLIGATVVLSAAVAIAAAALSDTDTVIGWVLVGASVLLAVLLGLLAWSGTEDVRDLVTVDGLHGANHGEHARWICWLESQRKDHADRLDRLEQKVGRIEQKVDQLLRRLPE